MAGAAKFFSLGDDATESDIHEKLENAKPLADQLEAAKVAGAADTAKELADIKDELKTVKEKLAELEKGEAAKDTRIAELQVELQEQKTAAEKSASDLAAMKTQHDKEIKVLAGQVSALKAGRPLEQDAGGDNHDAEKNAPKDGLIAIKSDALKDLVKKRQTVN